MWLQDKVERTLAAAAEGDDRTQAKAFGEVGGQTEQTTGGPGLFGATRLWSVGQMSSRQSTVVSARRSWPNHRTPSAVCLPCQACLYALLAYNTCLGQAITAAEVALEDKAAEKEQHAQVRGVGPRCALCCASLACCRGGAFAFAV